MSADAKSKDDGKSDVRKDYDIIAMMRESLIKRKTFKNVYESGKLQVVERNLRFMQFTLKGEPKARGKAN